MEAKQREVGDIMVEHNVFAPPGFTMTARALLAFLALVHIIATVTVNAVAGQFFTGENAAMAG